MNIKGRVVSTLPTETGQGKNGTWVKNTYIIETPGQYPKKVAVSLWGETLPVLKVDQEVDCHIDIESREYNQRWYTEVKCFKVDFVASASAAKSDKPKYDAGKESSYMESKVDPAFEVSNDPDSLPF